MDKNSHHFGLRPLVYLVALQLHSCFRVRFDATYLATLFSCIAMLTLAACRGSGSNTLTVETTEVQEEGTGGYSDDGAL